MLLSHGATVDALNKGQCSSLHVAVNKQHPRCVDVLIRHACNINIQVSSRPLLIGQVTTSAYGSVHGLYLEVNSPLLVNVGTKIVRFHCNIE